MAGRTLYDKLWQSHLVREEADGTAMIYIDRHLVHEVTSPQAYEGLKLAGRKVWRPDSVVATADHNTPTRNWDKGLDGITDLVSRLQVETLDKNIKEFKIRTPARMAHLRRWRSASVPARSSMCWRPSAW
ncbi:MAG: leuC [Proteobacteria bacterium]|nr:leuC [Pseudomonadota bacterium]